MKEDLRNIYKNKRKHLKNKKEKDVNIFNNIVNSSNYKQALVILCYFPREDEVNTIPIITKALKDNKKVALPVCLDGRGNMEFYYINSIDNLNVGFFGILEPEKKDDNLVRDFNNSLCIVPGYTFDKSGYRLGYGKGFYDKFLSLHDIATIGLCYEEFLAKELPKNEFDKKVDYICTEKEVLNIVD